MKLSAKVNGNLINKCIEFRSKGVDQVHKHLDYLMYEM